MSCTKIDPSNYDGPSRKRSRKSSKNPSNHKSDDRKSCYRNVLFHERKSSGRPGSPHRYFENSYDVSFQDDCVEDGVSSSLSSSSATTSNVTEAEADADESKVAPGITDDNDNQSITVPRTNESSGNQVVHRHVNGLCIITAGNILQTIILQQNSISNSRSDGNNSTNQQQQAEIVSIKYLVKVDPDAQSAKGKLRAKNKKRKKKKTNNNNNTDSYQVQQQHANNFGEVTPTDALCEVTLTNGEKVTLKCCVQGTVIELNHRLTSDRARGLSSSADVDGNSLNSKGDVNVDGNVSLLQTDPLLDGYLAVIMPNRGTNLPTL